MRGSSPLDNPFRSAHLPAESGREKQRPEKWAEAGAGVRAKATAKARGASQRERAKKEGGAVGISTRERSGCAHPEPRFVVVADDEPRTGLRVGRGAESQESVQEKA